jgi:hypothetical protein
MSDFVAAIFNLLAALCFVALICIIGFLIYDMATRGECVSRGSIGPVSFCVSWEKDLRR